MSRTDQDPGGADPLEWLHPAPSQTLLPASELQKGGSFMRPRFREGRHHHSPAGGQR